MVSSRGRPERLGRLGLLRLVGNGLAVDRHALAPVFVVSRPMNPPKLSTLDVVWTTRPGGGGSTERRYRDFRIDGRTLSSILKIDVISPFGWGASVAEEVAAIDRLLRRAEPDLPDGRTSLYVCPECGGLDCGAVSVVVDRGPGIVIWRDFAFQNNYDGDVQRESFERLGPFAFSGHEYHELLEQLKDECRARSQLRSRDRPPL